ncbi:MAG: hypothetical protein Tsb0016_12590 [Sphingomonadales bacterium]
MLFWFKSVQRRRQAQALYAEIVSHARRPEYYQAGAVPDTLDGRFDMISLVLALYLGAMDRLDAPAARDLAAAVEGLFFADMDRGLRELGVGDLSVGKQVKRMAEAFYGRRAAYQSALAAEDEAAFSAALARNVYRGAAPAPANADWLRGRAWALARRLQTAPAKLLLAGPLPLASSEGEATA